MRSGNKAARTNWHLHSEGSDYVVAHFQFDILLLEQVHKREKLVLQETKYTIPQ